jgi:hypothetical protein
MRHGFSKMIILGIIAAWQLSAATVTVAQDNTVNSTSAPETGIYWGETFQALASGSNLTFNFYSTPPLNSTTQEAFGTLYLLNQEYTGLPTDLSSSTPGYMGSASASGGLWTITSFTSGSIIAGDQYWVFTAAAQPSIYTISTPVPPDGSYFFEDNVEMPGFNALTDENHVFNSDLNFLATTNTGEREDTPEPTTLLLMAPALLLVLRRRLTR